VIRLRHRVLRAPWLSYPRTVPGCLTVTQLARELAVSPHWIHRRIRNGTIVVARHPVTGRWLFPEADATLIQLRKLKAGQIHYLDFDSHTDEQGHQHA
jgi:predicted site-specific integrase-resolvase